MFKGMFFFSLLGLGVNEWEQSWKEFRAEIFLYWTFFLQSFSVLGCQSLNHRIKLEFWEF